MEKPNSEKEKTKMEKKAEENFGGGGWGRTDTACVCVLCEGAFHVRVRTVRTHRFGRFRSVTA